MFLTFTTPPAHVLLKNGVRILFRVLFTQLQHFNILYFSSHPLLKNVIRILLRLLSAELLLFPTFLTPPFHVLLKNGDRILVRLLFRVTNVFNTFHVFFSFTSQNVLENSLQLFSKCAPLYGFPPSPKTEIISNSYF